MAHCSHCPVTPGKPCPGENAPRLCRKMDPADPLYRPGYERVILDSARQLAEHSLPSASRQAASLARALWDWACSGFAIATDEEQARRKGICRACPEFIGGRCRICGCRLSAKIPMRTEHCPKGFW